MSLFKKAERRQAKLKIAMTGPAGSGKTMSALRVASAIGKRIAVIDTENGSASLYADKFEFDTLNIDPPFTADKYVQAIEAAEKEGYDVIVVDSFSHAWAGEGGTLDKKSDLDNRGGNQFTNWRNPKRDYGRIKNALLHSTCHVIATIRSKQAYALNEDNGKNTVRRVGLDPIAEPGVEYEFTVMFEVSIDHKAQATKDRTAMFGDNIFLITEETGRKLVDWISSAKPEEPKAKPEGTASVLPLSKAQIDRLVAKVHAAKWTAEQMTRHLKENYKVNKSTELDQRQYEEVCAELDKISGVEPGFDHQGRYAG